MDFSSLSKKRTLDEENDKMVRWYYRIWKLHKKLLQSYGLKPPFQYLVFRISYLVSRIIKIYFYKRFWRWYLYLFLLYLFCISSKMVSAFILNLRRKMITVCFSIICSSYILLNKIVLKKNSKLFIKLIFLQSKYNPTNKI